MPKIMLINVTHSEESRVGIINEGLLEAFEIESLSREHLKGNIYKGTVHRIHPALEAAFVDIGADRDAFLPLDEICFRNLPNPPPPQNGNAEPGGNGRRRRRIRDVLRTGEEILVQITKEPFGTKPPTLTTFYSLPGRYLVLLPGSDEAGISRRIEGEDRSRLRKLISDLNPPEGFGLIVRTAAGFDNDTGELARDLGYLQHLWENVQQAAATKRAPALVYREHDIVLRTIRDFFTPDIDEIYIDNEEVFLRARDFLGNVMPGKQHVLHLYRGEQPIFSAFDVEGQFETIFKRRVALKSGGSIVIDGAEALTAIDVNSGGSVRGPNPEETAFRTNVEAAMEIARQLRLRDIGGLIVIDFIDMRESTHIQEIERIFRDGMRQDKARHEIGRISRLGLLEISRQRLRPTAMASTYTTCAMCEGHGAVRTTESAALVALRKIHHRVAMGDIAELRVALPSQVAMYLLNQKRDDLTQLEERYHTRIQVQLSEKLMPHQVEIEVRVRPKAEAPAPAALPPGAVAAPEAVATPASATTATVAGSESEPGKKKRRRRGRRRGKTIRAAIAIGEALAGMAPSSISIPASDASAADQPSQSPPAAEAIHVSAPEGRLHQAPTEHPSVSTDHPASSERPSGRGRRRGRRGGRSRRHGTLPPATTERATAPTADHTHAPIPPVTRPLQPPAAAQPSTSNEDQRLSNAPALEPAPAEAPVRKRSARPRATATARGKKPPTEAAAASSPAKAPRATPRKTEPAPRRRRPEQAPEDTVPKPAAEQPSRTSARGSRPRRTTATQATKGSARAKK